jgi:Ice-binding-like/Putative Ig domain
MKILSSSLSVAAALAALLGASTPASAQSILKTAGNYSILASQAITVAGDGFTFKDGNVGLYPAATSNITGFPPATVTGLTLLGTTAAIISTGGATQQAEADLQVAATGLAAMAETTNYSNVDMADLGPLPPGVYRWNAAATLTGALVLDAQGKNNVAWVFQFGTGLTTAANSTVTLINAGSNGGSDDGIFWNAATGAIVVGDNNTILGNYIAYTSLSFTGSTTLGGTGGSRFLALNAAVSFAGPGTVNALGGSGGGDWTGGLTLSGANVVLSATVPPVFTSPPAAGATTTGTTTTPFTYTVAATGSPTVYTATGLPPGVTLNSSTGVISGTPTAPGTYVVTVTSTNSSGTTSTTLTISITPPASSSHIVNFSARAESGPGSGMLTVGFVVSGNGMNLLLRGVGPGLAAFGISDFLANTTLTLFNANGTVDATDSGWQVNSSDQNDSALIASTAAFVGAFPLANGSMDSALLVTVGGGPQTAALETTDNSPGVGLVEIYDAGGNSGASLINVSARAQVSGGNGVLIAGFVIVGNAPRTVLVRGVGPTLAEFGVAGALADPMITVTSGSTTEATNVGWGTGTNVASQIASVSSQVGAFPLASGSKDSALLLTLQPGAYTVQLTSVSNSTGVALVEVYDTQ